MISRGILLGLLAASAQWVCAATDWPLWKSYTRTFMDDQVRVIDHDGGDRTTSEAQAYAMFFALVANDRLRFDGLLKWTEANLASGDLSKHLPAWLWGHSKDNHWEVLDSNSASDADLWMAYTLVEAGQAWNDPRYTAIGTALAKKISADEVVQVSELGMVLLPAPRGFHSDDSYRLNTSYMPVQLLLRLSHFLPDGPWGQMAAGTPGLLADSTSHGFAIDWTEFKIAGPLKPAPSPTGDPPNGSYDAIRVYLWAGMLNPASAGRDKILNALTGMTHYLHSNLVPPAKVRPDGSVEDPNGPVGFSAALLPYLSALGEGDLENQQSSRLQAALDSNGLYGKPPKYYDQNLALFCKGWTERRFWFDSDGSLKLAWKG
jgi:endoglucanase